MPTELTEPPDWLYQNITEASKQAGRIHALYVGFVFFCVLTLFCTSERQIIFDSQTRLPLIGTNISFSGFCLAVVVMGICIFAYFQIYLQKLRDLTLKLKTEYPLASPERIYPWFMTIVEGEKQSGILGFLPRVIVEVSIWYFLPILLSIIPFWLVRTHWPVHSYLSAAMPLLGIWLVIMYRAQYERMTFLQLLKAKKTLAGFTFLIFAWCLFLVSICIPWAMQGKTFNNAFRKGMYVHPYKWIWPLELKTTLGGWWCVDLSRQNLVTKPDIDVPGKYWIELPGLHLEGAYLENTALKRAYLHHANFQRAFIWGASFEESDLPYSNLHFVLASTSNFEGAKFGASNLSESLFEFANFRNVRFGQSNLTGSCFTESNLENTDLYNCYMKDVNLTRVNLQNAKLNSAKLYGACLAGANLQNATMDNTELDGAYLFKTDLRNTQNLKAEQLCKAASLWNTQMDKELMDQIQVNCPSLLEKPGNEPKFKGAFLCVPNTAVRK